MKANKGNFFVATEAKFKECKTPNRTPDYVSESGSEYWYTRRGVIRRSNHWNWVASCTWEYEGKGLSGELRTGFCKWRKFKLKPLTFRVDEFTLNENCERIKQKKSVFKVTFKMIKDGYINCFGYQIYGANGYYIGKSVHSEYERAIVNYLN